MIVVIIVSIRTLDLRRRLIIQVYIFRSNGSSII
jgi:hypothetical protein